MTRHIGPPRRKKDGGVDKKRRRLVFGTAAAVAIAGLAGIGTLVARKTAIKYEDAVRDATKRQAYLDQVLDRLKCREIKRFVYIEGGPASPGARKKVTQLLHELGIDDNALIDMAVERLTKADNWAHPYSLTTHKYAGHILMSDMIGAGRPVEILVFSDIFDMANESEAEGILRHECYHAEDIKSGITLPGYIRLDGRNIGLLSNDDREAALIVESVLELRAYKRTLEVIPWDPENKAFVLNLTGFLMFYDTLRSRIGGISAAELVREMKSGDISGTTFAERVVKATIIESLMLNYRLISIFGSERLGQMTGLKL